MASPHWREEMFVIDGKWAPATLWALLVLSASLPVARAESDTSISVTGRHRVQYEEYFPVIQDDGDKSQISMRVGTVRETHRATRIAAESETTFSMVQPGPGDTLMMVAVIPDDREGHRYEFELVSAGEVIHRRSGETRGFGRRTFFVPVPPPLLGVDPPAALVVRNGAAEDLYLAELVLLKDFDRYLEKAPTSDDFTLSLLVNDADNAPLMKIAADLPTAPGVRKAISSEIYYMERSEQELREQLRKLRRIAGRSGLGFVPVLCSWWAGTPQAVKERIDFQQICWSETDNHDEGQELRDFLGDKWDIRYGLTVPNKWSSTAWQTMNSPELNALRHARLEEAVRLIERVMPDQVTGYVVENEPAYWAFEGSDEKYPVRRKNLWADFNPQTVAHAERAGVILDPSDGLDITERVWLHYNVANYNQATADVVTSSGASSRVYSHALLDYDHFPLSGTGHARPYAEVARIRGARTGIEMIWKSDMDALWRVREWGQWGCVNREEWDGFGLDYHVGTLRACYMLGADMLNSYNWQSMGREGDPVRYFSRFLEDLSSGHGVITVGERSSGNEWRPLEAWDYGLVKNDASPWANALELTLRCSDTTAPLSVWLTDRLNGPVVAHRVVSPGHLASSGPTVIRFGDLARLEQEHDLHLYLKTEGSGWEMLGSFWGPNYRVLCDLREERLRSQYVMERSGEVRQIQLQTEIPR